MDTNTSTLCTETTPTEGPMLGGWLSRWRMRLRGGRDQLAIVVVSHPGGRGLGRRVRFGGSRDVVVGRSQSSDFQLSDVKTVSSEHARVLQRRRKMYVEDLDSTNGVHLNDVRVFGRVPLQEGDELRLGEVEMKVVRRDRARSLFRAEVKRARAELDSLDIPDALDDEEDGIDLYVDRELNRDARSPRYPRARKGARFPSFQLANDPI